MAVELSFCVVNTEQRELLVRCLDAIAAEREALPFETEVLVLDNASRDGSPAAARNHALAPEVIALERRTGKGENDTALLKRARGRYALLLNEDSELRPGAVMALREALQERDDAAAAGARLLRPDGTEQASAWRFPTPATALVGALFLHKRFTVQSRGQRTRKVDWAQSAALLVRTDAAREIELVRPGLLRLLRRGRLLPAPARRGLAHALRAGRGRRAPRAALDRQGARAADRRALAQPRPLHAQAPLRGRRRGGARAHGVGLRGARARGARAPRPRPAAVLAPRDRDAAPGSGRGAARGRGRAQPRPAPVTVRQCDWIAWPVGETTHHGAPKAALPWPLVCPGALSPAK